MAVMPICAANVRVFNIKHVRCNLAGHRNGLRVHSFWRELVRSTSPLLASRTASRSCFELLTGGKMLDRSSYELMHYSLYKRSKDDCGGRAG